MKKTNFTILEACLFLLMAGCKPTPMEVKNPTPEPSRVIPTMTWLPTSTPRPTPTPTFTPVIYWVRYGYCITDHALTGDPIRLKECTVKEKKQLALASGEPIKYSTSLAHQFASFCAIYQLDGKYITSFVDSQKFGEALCTLP